MKQDLKQDNGSRKRNRSKKKQDNDTLDQVLTLFCYRCGRGIDRIGTAGGNSRPVMSS